MILHSMKSACALAVILVLSACAGLGKKPPPDQKTMACDDSIAPAVEVRGRTAEVRFMKTLIAGKRARDILADASDLESALGEMRGQGATLQAKIENIRGGPLADGLAGVPARLFLDAAKLTLNRQTGNFEQDVSVDTTGQILAYFYDDATGRGCLQVLMVTTAKRANGNERSLAYRWTVFVEPTVDDQGNAKRGFSAAES